MTGTVPAKHSKSDGDNAFFAHVMGCNKEFEEMTKEDEDKLLKDYQWSWDQNDVLWIQCPKMNGYEKAKRREEEIDQDSTVLMILRRRYERDEGKEVVKEMR